MLTISIKSMHLAKGEQKAKEKLIKFLEQEFALKLVGDNIITEGSYDEHIKLYQLYAPKKSNARGAGRKKTGKTDLIYEYALQNSNKSTAEIAAHFNCSRQYIARVLKENKVKKWPD